MYKHELIMFRGVNFIPSDDAIATYCTIIEKKFFKSSIPVVDIYKESVIVVRTRNMLSKDEKNCIYLVYKFV